MNEIDSVFREWLDVREDAKVLAEGMQTSRYSIEVNYRTRVNEVVDSFAKLTLGYVSAGMKQCGYHCKVLFTDKPYRVMVSTRNWDDGEWVGVACFNHERGHFVIAQGTYNRDRKTVSVHSSRKCDAVSAAEIVRELRNVMEDLKRTPGRGSSTLQPAELKRGPKPRHLKKLKGVSGPMKRVI